MAWLILYYSVSWVTVTVNLFDLGDLLLFIQLVEAYEVDHKVFFVCGAKLDKVFIQTL